MYFDSDGSTVNPALSIKASNKRVSIGNDSTPDSKLHIKEADQDTNPVIKIENTTSSGHTAIELTRNGADEFITWDGSTLAIAGTNIAASAIKDIGLIKLSANWMAASGENREDLALRKGVEALSKIAVDLRVSIPVGKDSLSMKTKWSEGSNELEVTSPLSGVVTAMAPVGDISIAVTPELHVDKDSTIILVKLNNASRLSGSIFSEVTQSVYVNTPDIDDVTKFKDMFLMVQQLIKDRKLLAMHDISDGGLITTLAEMCFTKKIGMDIDVSIFDNTNESLFSEEIGFVLQASNANCDEIISSFLENNLFASKIASLADESLTILKDGEILFNESITCSSNLLSKILGKYC